MTDQIQIKDLLLRAILGINDEERRNQQDVLINITLHADTRAAGRSDDIADAVNYRTLTKRIIALVENSQFYLVEKMAAEIAALCLDDPRVEQADVRVEKPGALRFARSVGVEIQRTRADLKTQPHRVFLALGSNINAEHNLRAAVRRLASRFHLRAVSPVYETAPVGKTDQPNFLNAAAFIETDLDAAKLKQVLQAIEQELGRVRTDNKNAPRTIDLDISLFDGQVLKVGQRHIPDPDILRYPHIARPLADLAPQQRHPETGQTLQDIAKGLPTGDLRHTDIVLWPDESIRKEE
jgi:dihydroneopterin aldolase/2-amino-4-hydroxy-6-hydroxymethyldihydropteridine diphosphokinase